MVVERRISLTGRPSRQEALGHLAAVREAASNPALRKKREGQGTRLYRVGHKGEAWGTRQEPNQTTRSTHMRKGGPPAHHHTLKGYQTARTVPIAVKKCVCSPSTSSTAGFTRDSLEMLVLVLVHR